MISINIKGGGCFCSFSTQIYTITLSQLIKEERFYLYDFINNHSSSTFKDQNYLGLSNFGELVIDK